MKQILFILFAVFANVAMAQTPKFNILWEKELNKEVQGENSNLSPYLGEDENAYYFLSSKFNKVMYTEKYGIVKYDKKTLQPVSVKPLDGMKNVLLRESFWIGDEKYLRFWENPRKSSSTYGIYRLNMQNMTLESVTKQFFSGLNFKNWSYTYASPDKSKVMIVFLKDEQKHNTKQKFQLIVFDNHFNKLWEKEMETPFLHNNVSNSEVDFTLDNSGNVYLYGKLYNENLKNISIGNNTSQYIEYTFNIIKLSEDGSKQQDFKLDINGHLYNKCNLQIDKQNNLLVFGLYSDKNMKTTGACYFLLDKDFKTVKNLSFQEIPLKWQLLYIENSEARYIEKNITERFSGFQFSKPFYTENGDIIIYVENRYLLVSNPTENPTEALMSTSKAPQRIRNIFVAKDAYVFRITPEKTLAWMKRVPKNQRAVDDETSGWTAFSSGAGCLPFLSGDSFSLLFADNDKNLNVKENSENAAQENIGNNPFYCVTLDKDGKQTKQAVAGIKEDKFIPGLREGIYLTNDSYLLYARTKDNGKRKLGIISLGK